MTFRFLHFLQIFFLIADLISLNIILVFNEPRITLAEVNSIGEFSFYWSIFNLYWLLILLPSKIYTYETISFFTKFFKRTVIAYVFWSFMILVTLFFLRSKSTISRTFVYSTILHFFALLFVNRAVYLFVKIGIRNKIDLKRRIIILGYNAVSQKLASYLNKVELDVRVIGYIEDEKKIKGISRLPIYSNIENTMEILKRQRVNEVYSTIMPENNNIVYNLMSEADMELIRFRIVPDFANFINKPVHINYLFDLPVLSIRKEPLEEVINRFWKRTFDLIISSLVLYFILSWMVPLIGLLIKLESKGPIFFTQIRTGKNNKPFRCYKFRSMATNSEANTTQATKNDARITTIGRILRKTSLDEFPQFMNVLRGEMSVVGPRPHMLKHTKNFSHLADDYMIRQFLKPGITGWAQVNGYRGEITELQQIKKRVEYDLWYLENWSLQLDFRIIFLTVYNVFKGEENAY